MSAPADRSQPSSEVLEAAADACAVEPIRVPGSIQPHGVLLAVDPGDLRVVVASAGAGEHLGAPAADVVGAALADLVPDAVPVVAAVAAGDDDAGASPTAVALPGAGRLVDLLAHRSDGLVVLELEATDGDEDEATTGSSAGSSASSSASTGGAAPAGSASSWHAQLPSALRRLQSARSVADLAEALVAGVRRLTGFDRVMVYRFDEEWNGEVVAEERRADLEPFHGLHYPASDIPAQARALYARQWLRIIPDATYSPVPLVPAAVPSTGGPLDLSQAVLRSVSPVHLEYLGNMGVRSSMSISLLHEGRLWGLIACHHYAGPHRPSQPVRSAAEFLGRTASVLLPTAIGDDASGQVLAASAVRSLLTEHLSAHPDLPLEALTRETPTLADLVPCGGAALRLHGELRLLGLTPPASDVAALLDELGDEPLVTASLGLDDPRRAGLSATASGVLAVPLDGGAGGDAVAWFRPEVLKEVTWGGDPHRSKVVTDGDDGVRLSPRRSFDAWSETVRGTATRWAPHEVEAATGLAAHLSDTLLRQVQRTSRLATALQRTLLLAELPTLPQLDVAVRYSPHSADVVGGDWYDIIPLPSGCIAVVLGDVAGHGLSASAISAQMRNGLRAYLLGTEDAAAAVQQLNDLVVALMPGELATAVVAVLDPGTGAVDVVNAGHPPLLALRGGVSSLVADDDRGPALGLVAGVTYATSHLQLEPGEMLLFYSDGLVEDRSVAWDERLAVLLRDAAAPAADLDSLCARLVGTVSSHADDTTVLALRSTRAA